MVQDQFWSKVKENRIEANILFEQSSSSSGESTITEYKTPYMDHKKGEGILINLRSILRMLVERSEICWADVKFEARSQMISTIVIGLPN